LWFALGEDEPTTAAETPPVAAASAGQSDPQSEAKRTDPAIEKLPGQVADAKPQADEPPALKPKPEPASEKAPASPVEAKPEVTPSTQPQPAPPPQIPPQPQVPPPAEGAIEKPVAVDPPSETPPEGLLDPVESPSPVAARPPLPPVEVQAQLAISIPQLNIAKARLDRYLDLLSGISTIPITLDASIVEFAQTPADKPVSVRLSNTTIKRALDQALADAKLSYQVGPDHIVVTPPTELTEEWIVVRVALGDLSGGDPKRRGDIAALVPTLVSPQSWKTSRPTAGEGEIQVDGDDLVVRQTRRVQKEVAEFLERLRTARRAAEGGGDLSLLATRRQRIDAAFSRKITLNYSVPAALSRVLSDLGEQAGLTIMVDWLALRAVRIGPQSSARMTAANEPVESALASLLAPLELTYRILDARTIQITTPAAAAEAMRVEFYPLRQLAENTARLNKLVGDFRRDWAAKGHQPAGLFHFDALSGCLVVRHSQAAHSEFERRLTAAR
jgi:hypothetical protein